MTDERDPIAWMRGLVGRATPRPWSDNGTGMVVAPEGEVMLTDGYVAETPRTMSADARAIAVAHNVMPELLAVAQLTRAYVDGESVAPELVRALDALDAAVRAEMERQR